MRIWNGGGVEMICCMLYTLNDLMTVMMMNDQTILSIIVFFLSSCLCISVAICSSPPHISLYTEGHIKKTFSWDQKTY